jgi:hypothetical protein
LLLCGGCANSIAPVAPHSCECIAEQSVSSGSSELFVAVVTAPVHTLPEHTEALKRFGLTLSAELAKTTQASAPLFHCVECRAGDAIEQALTPLVQQRPYLAVTPDDVAWLTNAFTADALNRRMADIAATLEALPADSLERRRLQHDPLDVIAHAEDTVRRRLQARTPAFADANGWYLSADETTLLVLARTLAPSTLNRADILATAALARDRAIAKSRPENPLVANFSVAFITPGSDAAAAREQVSARFGRSIDELRIIAEAPTEAQAYAARNAIGSRLKPFVEQGAAASAMSLLDMIPSVDEQRQNFAALQQFDFAVALKAFQTAAEKQFGTRGLVFFKPFLQRFEKFHLLTREPQPLTWTEALSGPLGGELAPYLKVSSDGRVSWMISVFPRSSTVPDRKAFAHTLEQNPPTDVSIRVDDRR